MFTQRDLDWLFGRTNSGVVARYPLTNIGFDADEVLYIDVAIAGFSKDEIQIEQKENKLYITGRKLTGSNEVTYIQEHISKNDFERVIVLSENYVDGTITANVSNGLLIIQIEPELPKEPTKKLIQIG